MSAVDLRVSWRYNRCCRSRHRTRAKLHRNETQTPSICKHQTAAAARTSEFSQRSQRNVLTAWYRITMTSASHCRLVRVLALHDVRRDCLQHSFHRCATTTPLVASSRSTFAGLSPTQSSAIDFTTMSLRNLLSAKVSRDTRTKTLIYCSCASFTTNRAVQARHLQRQSPQSFAHGLLRG